MPPRLHPRSTLTSSLFATTLLASFLVVGIPHLVPCPAPRVVFADGEMPSEDSQKRRRGRRKCVNTDGLPEENYKDLNQLEAASDEDENTTGTLNATRSRRECPVPKPTGIVGEMLGFKDEKRPTERDGESSRPP